MVEEKAERWRMREMDFIDKLDGSNLKEHQVNTKK
jgi:hypothetical protein